MAKILIIDDESGMLQVMTKILGPLGHSILTAQDGAQGLAAAEKERPDLVLADIHLPDMDGGALLAALKRLNARLPVIILSGFGDVDVAVDLVRQGAFDYISKPFKIEDLVSLVQKALSKSPDSASPAEQKPSATGSPFTVTAENEPVPVLTEAPASRSSRKAIFIAAPAALLLLAAAVFFAVRMGAPPPHAEFAISYANPSGICWDGKKLWIADWASEAVHEHTRDAKLSGAGNFKTPGVEPSGLAFDGEFIWVSHSFGQKIYKHRRDASFSVVTSFVSPGPSPSGLYFDGNSLWSADFQQGKIYKHRLDSTLTVVSSYDSPAANPCAIFGYDGCLYIADTKTNRIYKVRADNFSLAGIYILPGFENQARHLASIAWDGKSIWACSDGVEKIFRYRMKDLAPAKL